VNKKFKIFILVLIPLLAQLVFFPFVNKATPIIIGMPLLQFWCGLWIILTPVCSYLIYKIQKSEGGLEE
jgi:hypothetical protein